MNQANSTKLIPYGMTDFPAIIRNNYYYVDKTEYIRQIEQTARFFFFVRPRRFGKSLFLNMLECYYDCKTEKQFDELFGNLYVGKHPTPRPQQVSCAEDELLQYRLRPEKNGSLIQQ